MVCICLFPPENLVNLLLWPKGSKLSLCQSVRCVEVLILMKFRVIFIVQSVKHNLR